MQFPPAWQREAEEMRRQYEADAANENGASGGGAPRLQRDYSLKEGQTLRVELPQKVSMGLVCLLLGRQKAPRHTLLRFC